MILLMVPIVFFLLISTLMFFVEGPKAGLVWLAASGLWVAVFGWKILFSWLGWI